jgi:hypothetical protein
VVSEILGIRPTALGFREATISPKVELLDRADGVVATPLGELGVGWRTDGERKHLAVRVPSGLKAVLRVDNSETALSAGTNDVTIGAKE